jgi:hypothetical protein
MKDNIQKKYARNDSNWIWHIYRELNWNNFFTETNQF